MKACGYEATQQCGHRSTSTFDHGIQRLYISLLDFDRELTAEVLNNDFKSFGSTSHGELLCLMDACIAYGQVRYAQSWFRERSKFPMAVQNLDYSHREKDEIARIALISARSILNSHNRLIGNSKATMADICDKIMKDVD